MHFLGKWLRLPMAIEILMHFWMCSITLPSSTDVNSFRKRLWRSNESTHFTEYLEGVSGIAIQHIRWRLQSSKHVSERAGGCFFSIGPSVLIGLCSLYRVETSAPGLSGYYWYIPGMMVRNKRKKDSLVEICPFRVSTSSVVWDLFNGLFDGVRVSNLTLSNLTSYTISGLGGGIRYFWNFSPRKLRTWSNFTKSYFFRWDQTTN